MGSAQNRKHTLSLNAFSGLGTTKSKYKFQKKFYLKKNNNECSKKITQYSKHKKNPKNKYNYNKFM